MSHSRMYDQLRALWSSKSLEQPFVKGILLSANTSNHYESSEIPCSRLSERWFTLLGHSLFYSKYKDCPEFSGALLTDLFSPVIARVDLKTLQSFHLAEAQQPNVLYLKGILMEVEVLICPQSMEEKRIWLEKFQHAGLSVPTREPSVKQGRGKDGREKVVVINGSINDSLYISPTHKVSSSSLRRNQWAQQWKKAAQKVLSLPDASQIRIKFEFLQKFFDSETRYLSDLTTLVEVYYRQFRIAVNSGHVTLRREQLDAIFLNCENLLMLHKLLCSHLKKILSQPSVRIGDLLLLFIPHMEIYAEFVRNHEKSIKILEDCLQNSSLADFLENHHSSHDCEAHQLKILLHQPVTRLEIYQAFVEKVLEQTSEDHVDYIPLGQALEGLQDLKNALVKASSRGENQDRILSIIESVGARGFLLLQPECKLILEDEMYLPATSKRVTGTIRRRPIHCYLYSNALVVISMDKKTKQASNRSQVFPLNGATVYEHVSRTGEVTYAKDPELEIRALKIYSPNGPRNGVIIIFLTQSNKSLWLSNISEMISQCTPDPIFPPSPPPLLAHSVSVITPPPSPVPSERRRLSTGAVFGNGSPPSSRTLNGTSPPSRRSSTNNGNASPPTSHTHNGHASPSSHTYSGHTSPPLNHTYNGHNHRLADNTPSNMRDSPILKGRTRSLITFDTEEGKHTQEIKPKTEYLSIPTLFSQLISSPPNPHYPYTFLLTYRMFTNAHEVLDALIEGHRKELNARTPASKMNGSVGTESLRFFNILKLWVNKYYVDFHHDVTLKRVLVSYLDSVKGHSCTQEKEMELAEGLLKIVSQRDHIPLIRRSKLRIQIPKAINPVPEQISDVAPDVLAKQLTWIEHELYSRIKPYEFLQQKWTKKNRLELAPNICHIITRFNQMTEWISKLVLSPEQPRQRCAMINKMMLVAQHALELHNFVTVFQIAGALSSTAIQRLKKTWDLIPQNMIEQYEEMKKLTSIEGTSRCYRRRQNNSPAPSVPYIGPYLSQLIAIEVGMPTFVKDPPEHVNLSKLTKLAKVIEEIMRFQNPSYSFAPDGSIMIFIERELESSREFDEDQRYSRSMELEPRKHTNKRFAKLSSSSGD